MNKQKIKYMFVTILFLCGVWFVMEIVPVMYREVANVVGIKMAEETVIEQFNDQEQRFQNIISYVVEYSKTESGNFLQKK
ncbi:hypothetical protein [Aneurinibacillus uraniidurans]|uniref:hypothetical protein n=1 Tax=Aneurinibacillus uraniidurans TaxID=2966586 RepID=UPI002349594C|nr:hypothetical protein [Aneurinibacillus sp. B1]WCN36399.1 hypothetical protein PO771_10915 [Aneurinibacillus sp. B1]